MIINKEKMGKLKNNNIKRLVALGLLTTIPLSQTACKSDDKYDAEILTPSNNYLDSNDEYILDDNFFGNRKAYYEYSELEDLNNIIDEIKSVNYITENDFFNEFDIYNSSSREISAITSINDYYEIKSTNYAINYDWYVNGEVDSNLLYKRLVENTVSKGIKMDESLVDATKKISEEFKRNVRKIKQQYNDFDFSVAFYNMNNLIVTNCYDDFYISYYETSENEISVNFNNINDEMIFRLYMNHETIHATTNKVVGGNRIYMTGISLDRLDTIDSPFSLDFLNEYCTQKMACENLSCPELMGYYEETEKMNLINYSTNNDDEYFLNCYINSDQNKLIDSFQSELQNVNYAYSTLYAFDLACGYGNFPEGCDIDEFKKDCFDYGRLNLVKNAYVRIIKDYSIGMITKDEAFEKIEQIKFDFDNLEFRYNSNESNSSYYELVNKLDSIVKSYINAKTK